MPPRLEHKKSRRGCQRCKVRKVKCDEIHPVCSACQRHQVHCVYTDDSISPHKNPPSTSSARSPDSVVGEQSKGKQLSPWGPASPYDLVGVEAYPPEERRLLELHLLHRYLTRDVVSFQHWNDTETLKNVWLTHAVTMGLKHSFLLNAIFALAALHAAVVPADENYPQPLFDSLVNSNLASVEGVESVESTGSIDYAKIHRIHLNLAVSEVRQALSQLSSSNAEALCLVSIILSIMAQKLIPEHNEMSQEYTPPVQYLSMSHSITTVFQASIPLISHTSVLQSLVSKRSPICLSLQFDRKIFFFFFPRPLRKICDCNHQISTSLPGPFPLPSIFILTHFIPERRVPLHSHSYRLTKTNPTSGTPWRCSTPNTCLRSNLY